MPTKKSSKNIKKGAANSAPKTRELEFKDDMQEYGKVMSLLGDKRIMVMLPNRTEVMGIIAKRMKRQRMFVAVDDVVIVSLRDFQVDKTDIVYKYTPAEVQRLIQYQEVPNWFDKTSSAIATDGLQKSSEDLGFDFKDTADESDDAIDFDDI